MNLILCGAALIAIICIISTKVSGRLGLPTLLIFMLLGMLVGSDGLLGLPFSDYNITQNVCTVGLIFIMFYGGFGTSWKHAKPYAVQAGILSSLGTILTALIVAAGAYYFLHLSFTESFLLGSVIASTDAASVFNILRSRRLNLKGGLAPLLEVESGSNDPFAYLLTSISLLILAGAYSASSSVINVILQLSIGIGAGALIGISACKILKKISFGNDGSDTIFILSLSLLSFAAPEMLGGNGFLSVYIAGMIVGNSAIAHKIELVHFFDGLTTLSQMVIFLLFGLLSFPSRLPLSIVPALIVIVILTFIARPLAMSVLLLPFKRSFKEIAFVSVAGLRGAASLVFAVIAITQLTKAQTPVSYDHNHTIFWVVIFSKGLQGSLIPFAAKKLDLVDDKESVMKTFNDYEEDGEFNLVEFMIHPKSRWDGKALKDLELPTDALAVLIRRGDKNIIPQGSSVLQAGDHLVMNYPGYTTKAADLELNELELDSKHPWINHQISDLRLAPHALIVLIKRGQKTISPRGSSRLLRGDTLVITGTLPEELEETLPKPL